MEQTSPAPRTTGHSSGCSRSIATSPRSRAARANGASGMEAKGQYETDCFSLADSSITGIRIPAIASAPPAAAMNSRRSKLIALHAAHCVVHGASRERHVGDGRILIAGGCHARAVGDEEVGNIVGLVVR